MAGKLRKGSTVYAKVLIDQDILFPGAAGTYYIKIPQGAKGKVIGTEEEDLLLVKFANEYGSWYVAPRHLQRTKPK